MTGPSIRLHFVVATRGSYDGVLRGIACSVGDSRTVDMVYVWVIEWVSVGKRRRSGNGWLRRQDG